MCEERASRPAINSKQRPTTNQQRRERRTDEEVVTQLHIKKHHFAALLLLVACSKIFLLGRNSSMNSGTILGSFCRFKRANPFCVHLSN